MLLDEHDTHWARLLSELNALTIAIRRAAQLGRRELVKILLVELDECLDELDTESFKVQKRISETPLEILARGMKEGADIVVAYSGKWWERERVI